MSALCACGCGTATELAKRTDARKGQVRGEPMRYCRGHNSRWKQDASLPGTGDDRRFRGKYVAAPSGCWEWQGSCHKGYGLFSVAGQNIRAHRWAYERWVGPIPDGLQLDHLCRNPGCVNPEHLEAVTSRENTLRGTSLVAENARKRECKRGHAFTDDNVRISGGRRICLTCERARDTLPPLVGAVPTRIATGALVYSNEPGWKKGRRYGIGRTPLAVAIPGGYAWYGSGYIRWTGGLSYDTVLAIIREGTP